MAQSNIFLQRTYLPFQILPASASKGETQVVLDYLSSPMNTQQNRITSIITYSNPTMIGPEYQWRPDILADDVYGGSGFGWWIICRYNAVIHPLHPTLGFYPGKIINVPSAQDVLNWLKQLGVSTSTANQIVTI